MRTYLANELVKIKTGPRENELARVVYYSLGRKRYWLKLLKSGACVGEHRDNIESAHPLEQLAVEA